MSEIDAGPKGPLPPHRLIRDFLPDSDHQALLQWALESEDQLRPSIVGTEGQVYPEHRGSRSLHIRSQLGPWKDMICKRLKASLPTLFQGAGLRPFEVSRYELELVVYQDGARFGRHVDTMRVGAVDESDRLVTGVYYFHSPPKAYSGGALRLYRFGQSGDQPEDYVEIEPEQNSLLVFPSFASHEVRTVRCPSGRYRDSRFAVNCWLERVRPRAGQG